MDEPENANSASLPPSQGLSRSFSTRRSGPPPVRRVMSPLLRQPPTLPVARPAPPTHRRLSSGSLSSHPQYRSLPRVPPPPPPARVVPPPLPTRFPDRRSGGSLGESLPSPPISEVNVPFISDQQSAPPSPVPEATSTPLASATHPPSYIQQEMNNITRATPPPPPPVRSGVISPPTHAIRPSGVIPPPPPPPPLRFRRSSIIASRVSPPLSPVLGSGVVPPPPAQPTSRGSSVIPPPPPQPVSRNIDRHTRVADILENWLRTGVNDIPPPPPQPVPRNLVVPQPEPASESSFPVWRSISPTHPSNLSSVSDMFGYWLNPGVFDGMDRSIPPPPPPPPPPRPPPTRRSNQSPIAAVLEAWLHTGVEDLPRSNIPPPPPPPAIRQVRFMPTPSSPPQIPPPPHSGFSFWSNHLHHTGSHVPTPFPDRMPTNSPTPLASVLSGPVGEVCMIMDWPPSRVLAVAESLSPGNHAALDVQLLLEAALARAAEEATEMDGVDAEQELPVASGSGSGGGEGVSPARGNEHCVVCFDRPKQAVLVPCGHIALCTLCATNLHYKREKCPICRKYINQVVRTFYA
ncbi:hypothetical protein M427DRAFT_57967 [Gonapodya prolifera JEL478]|uniref:RING-type domain-containing protein n=1 Tax=Gonapodya prolifera (strain JEL478) TaxID=1344416 RepID=A0A139AAX8_GONPJ|nr:hypothetical protein M427DRAFT_57967 [Gonapodya prolifera JEL478]|eukprot:KXS13956.1 hypothetical protein M427DRAFT_57967 [Gonapodya prolifera JEL478]